MAHRFGFDGPAFVIQLSGTLTRSDLEAVGNEIIALERGGTNAPNRLTDLRTVTATEVGYPEMSQLAALSRARPLSAPIRSAILVGQPLQLGFARMFQIMNDHPLVTVQIFEDEAAARAWIFDVGEAAG
jgi:hypothetical protein